MVTWLQLKAGIWGFSLCAFKFLSIYMSYKVESHHSMNVQWNLIFNSHINTHIRIISGMYSIYILRIKGWYIGKCFSHTLNILVTIKSSYEVSLTCLWLYNFMHVYMDKHIQTTEKIQAQVLELFSVVYTLIVTVVPLFSNAYMCRSQTSMQTQ